MRRRTKLIAGAVGLAAVTAAAATTYSSRRTDRVDYETVLSLDGVELRRYPGVVLVETTAPSSRAAFSRLFQYINGENEGSREVAMTAPVRTEGAKLSMTTPVRVGRRQGGSISVPVRGGRGDGRGGGRRGMLGRRGSKAGDSEGGESVTMSFYLPKQYALDTAPEPTNPDVELVAEPPQTLAVRGFSWWPTERRVAAQERRLLDALESHDIETAGDPFFLGYDAPGTLPFLRTNEVAVPVQRE